MQLPATSAACTGLCDAHVHVTATTANLAGLYSLPESLVTARAVDILEGIISRGFTTVRDAGAACAVFVKLAQLCGLGETVFQAVPSYWSDV